MEFQSIIDEGGQLLKQSELGRMNAVIRCWSTVQWKPVPHSQGFAAAHDRERNVINLFGDLAKISHIQQMAEVMAAFGTMAFQQMAPEPAQHRWEWKLTLPKADQIDQVQERLKNPLYKSYQAIKDSFDRLMDRYVSINLTNALQANGIKREEAANINLRTWGTTLEYANIRKMHSIRPFVGAYGPRKVAECPGEGLAELLVHKMGHITESSMAESLGRLIVEVFTMCRDQD